MFTGIVQAVGAVRSVAATSSGKRFVIGLGALGGREAPRPMSLGDSVAVNGACLTVVEFGPETFAADVSAETLRVTTLGLLGPGSPVNLEPALTLADPRRRATYEPRPEKSSVPAARPVPYPRVAGNDIADAASPYV